MDNLIKVGVSVVSISDSESNNDNFYIDGRYKQEYEQDKIQVSVERSSELHLFGLTFGMDRSSPEMKTPVSMVRELKKFQSRISTWGGDIDGKLEQMSDCVNEINNIIYSMSINNPEHRDKPYSFAGLLMDGGMAAAVSSGSSRIYLMRDGRLNQLSGENSKIERLLRAGIISKEQAKSLSSKMDGISGNSMAGVQKSNTFHLKEGDIFLICSDNIVKAMDEQAISEVLSKDADTDYMANMLVKKAINMELSDGISVMIVKVELVNSPEEDFEINVERNTESEEDFYEDKGKRKSSGFTGTIVALITCIVVAVSLYYLYNELWPGKHQSKNDIPTGQTSTLDPTDSKSGGKNGDSQDQQSDEIGENHSGGEADAEGDASSGENEGAEPVVHIVEPGDTLQGISKKYYNDIEKYTLIMEANGLTDPNKLMVGQKLIIPED